MLINDNPMSTVPNRQDASSLVVSYQSKAACPHCGTYSSRRVRRTWLDRIRTFFTAEFPFFCSVCHSRYYAGFVEFTFDRASTASAGLMSLHKALGPNRPLLANELQRAAEAVRANRSSSTAREYGLQQGASSH